MTTDITKLAQSLKSAAEKAGADVWQAKKISGDYYVIRKGSYKREFGYETYQPIAEIDHKPTMDYIALANPENILALVDELDKAQQRIAELEYRTVKLPDSLIPYPSNDKEQVAYNAGWNACRAAMLNHFEQRLDMVDHSGDVNEKAVDGNSPANPDCWCRTCRPVVLKDMRFVVCPDCGNKRCPRANDHRNACTGSNEPGQEGSAYPAAPQSPGSEPATMPGKWIPVSERMPEVGDIVLASIGVGVTVGETECTATELRFFTSVISGRELPATHWMPMPSAPLEDKQ